MARRVQVVLDDDIDGTLAAETVSFALDGTEYEIDLSEGNAARLRDALREFVDNARRVSPPPRKRRGAGQRSPAGRHDSADVRRWAREQGLPVSGRGRIPADIIAQYEAAHHEA